MKRTPRYLTDILCPMCNSSGDLAPGFHCGMCLGVATDDEFDLEQFGDDECASG